MGSVKKRQKSQDKRGQKAWHQISLYSGSVSRVLSFFSSVVDLKARVTTAHINTVQQAMVPLLDNSSSNIFYKIWLTLA